MTKKEYKIPSKIDWYAYQQRFFNILKKLQNSWRFDLIKTFLNIEKDKSRYKQLFENTKNQIKELLNTQPITRIDVVWLSIRLKLEQDVLIHIIKKFKKTHKSWFRKFYSYKNHKKILECYSPEFVSMLEENITNGFEKSTSWWMNKEDMCSLFNMSKFLLRHYIKKNSPPEWEQFKIFLNQDNKPVKYYSKSFFQKIKNHIESPTPKKPSWRKTKNAIFKKIQEYLGLKISYRLIDKLIDEYKTKYPDDFKEFLNEKNMKLVHYSPKFYEKIKNCLLENTV